MIVIIVVLLGLGIFVLIKPAWEKLNAAKLERDQLKSTWEAKLNEFDNIPLRQQAIETRYQKGCDLAENFLPEMDAVEFEKYMQDTFINTEKFKEDGVELLENLSLTNAGTASLSYYYYTPSIVTYPLYEVADLDGSLAAATSEKLAESKLYAARSTQTVGGNDIQLKLRINREDIMSLIDTVKDYAKAKTNNMMIIDSITFENYGFSEEYVDQKDEDGNVIKEAAVKLDEKNQDTVDPGYTEVTITYHAYFIQEPTKPDVGPSYDRGIWDGDEWRIAVAE
jgi:hypothetical protein